MVTDAQQNWIKLTSLADALFNLTDSHSSAGLLKQFAFALVLSDSLGLIYM